MSYCQYPIFIVSSTIKHVLFLSSSKGHRDEPCIASAHDHFPVNIYHRTTECLSCSYSMLLLYNQQLLCLNITVQNCTYQENFRESCLFWLMMCNNIYMCVCVCVYIYIYIYTTNNSQKCPHLMANLLNYPGISTNIKDKINVDWLLTWI